MRAYSSWQGLTIAGLLILGCPESSERTDAGTRTDAGPARDAGSLDAAGLDAGPGGDAGSAGCAPACETGRDCCGGECVNRANDPRNCGECGNACSDPQTYCTGGTCIEQPCETSCGDPSRCCGSECCGPGQICCDPQGPVDIGPRCTEPDERGTCPQGCAPLCMCASPDTPVATPSGNRPIASLRIGDLVYSVEEDAIVVAPVVRTNRKPVSAHRVMRVELANGATLEISALHPTADGRAFADLREGGTLDGIDILAVAEIPYAHDATYDILPATSTGTYFAGGVLVGSTLHPDTR